MKRLFAVFLAVLMLTLCACGGAAGGTGNSGNMGSNSGSSNDIPGMPGNAPGNPKPGLSGGNAPAYTGPGYAVMLKVTINPEFTLYLDEAQKIIRTEAVNEDAETLFSELDVTGQSSKSYELKPEDPQGASYAVRIQGDSMEPYFPDGSIAFVNHDQMRDGDIGIFCVDGATVCKQWHYDETLGITYLFSLNRARADADVVVTNGSGVSLVWQGRVMTRRRFDLPRE